MQNARVANKIKLILCLLFAALLKPNDVTEAYNTARNAEKLNYILNYKNASRYHIDNRINKTFLKKKKLKGNTLNSFNDDVKTIREDMSADSSPVEKYNFKAEVNKVMDIIVNSLYTDKDVFLRELISNASDACDKKRIILQNEKQMKEAQDIANSSVAKSDVEKSTPEGANNNGEVENKEQVDEIKKLIIKIKPDKETKTLTITDNGIGMDKNELINNLGTIAQSGTAKFLKQIEEGKADSNLIGQFGVGFYSSFLVSKKVEVFTKKENTIFRWFSDLNGSFMVNEIKKYEQEYEDIQSSGTKIVLHLKEECDEYLEDYKLKELIKKYSEFIKFPIEIWSEKIDYERVPDDSVSLKDGDKMKMKTITKRYHEWEKINVQLPIWKQDEKKLTENDYYSFYKNTFKAYDDPLAYVHFNVEGQISFNSILYIPGSLPWELSKNMFDEESRGIRLYVKRVFINDKFSESIPRWLTFLRGIVDSENLPLNVGREILQKSKMLSIINKRIVLKSISMMKGLKETGGEKWNKFLNTFGKYLKIGVVEDKENQEEIASLVEFYSINSGDKKIDLDTYIENMKPDQKCIYYISGENKKTAQNSPSLEKLKALNYDVLFSLEPIDEFCLSSLTVNKYKGYDVLDVNKADLKLKKENDQNQTDSLDKLKMKYEILCRWLHNKFSHKVHEVRISDRLINSPALLVQGEMGISPSMQKYMKQQATAQGMSENEMFGGQSANQPVLEINPNHYIIKQLNHLIQIDKMNSQNSEIAEQIFDIASMQGGYTIDDTGLFAKRVIGMMEKNAQTYLMNVQGNLDSTPSESSPSSSSEPAQNSAQGDSTQGNAGGSNPALDNPSSSSESAGLSEPSADASSTGGFGEERLSASNLDGLGGDNASANANANESSNASTNSIGANGLSDSALNGSNMNGLDPNLYNIDRNIFNDKMFSGSDKTVL
ncbi:heat shock protein 90, putative [Plasmodium vivax]|uniref:Heat shock protein, putative n=6 Tax=Plasmodium vivax TaxID=5855 RepID=A5K3X1_PLAVS|nr:heat shock protein, putative [Plasmodium vivax]KMZ78926.1 heat shock protein [Plasmodium vivax India VII]KMZ87131.1 heat shock protein [Plasmodium vivax Brazil I]KMZ91770.1 heat shock protein [Plasmodium vivax Mauritania I]KMZ97793.1 heat shock protein [Plasmodium vivax North Korean]EDL46225.1 heat shock protein, putative [Plasmodium vivax]|eukprot:XP_001615952.1 heat shock protein [Plasmodium vivax Sal-1]